MTTITRTFDPEEHMLVPRHLWYRSRLGMAMALRLDDQKDKDLIEKAWALALSNVPYDCGAPPDPNAIPTFDQAMRFIQSNPVTSASVLIEHWRVARETDRCSDGRLREIWKEAGGAVTKEDRAWIEVHLLPGLLRLLSEIPK